MQALALLLVSFVPSGLPAATAPSLPAAVRLVDVSEQSGVTFVHRAAPSAERQLPETMGAGVVLFDADVDGDLDLYFVQGGPARAAAERQGYENELWRNDGRGHFTRAPRSGGAADAGLGMGACVGDVDDDGDPDLFVTNVGADVLYRNRGDGSFERDAAFGATGTAWSSSCTFVDIDGDADLDLFVASYVDHDSVKKNPHCGDVRRGVRAYCHPDVFSGVRDTLYLNDGRGGFTDVTEARGLTTSTGKGLGVLALDPDADGDLDLLVANDSTPNFLWRNDGRGHFTEVGVRAGLAYDENGVALAGMGIVGGDVNADGWPDVFVTNLDLQVNTLSMGSARGFREETAARGLAAPSLGVVGFGTELFDLDLDGDLDLFVANGHVIDNIQEFNPQLHHAQPDQLFENDGQGRFRLLGAAAGDVGVVPRVSRGAAVGDLDGDGDLDLVVTTWDGAPRLFRNEGAEHRPHVVLDLVGTASGRDAYGARAEVRDQSGQQVLARGEVQAARSYLSQGTRLLHLAWPAGAASVSVRWPSGQLETWRGFSPGRRYWIREGSAAAGPSLVALGLIPQGVHLGQR